MNIIIYFISGVLITFLFRFFDRHFTRYIFSDNTLIIGRFIFKHPLLSVLFPVCISFILTIILKSNNRIEYLLPGFIASFCIVWPKLYAPEILPSKVLNKRLSVNILFVWIILVFTIFSYVGGEFGSRFIFPMKNEVFDPTTSYVTWLFVGFALLTLKRRIKV